MDADLTIDQKREVLKAGKLTVDRLTRSVRETEMELEAVQKMLHERRTLLESAKALLEYHRASFGEEVSEVESSPFAGLRTQAAVLRVIQGRKGAAVTFPQIIEELRQNNYEIASEHPSRAIHAALMKVHEVERVGKGLYRWRNGNREESAEAG